MTDKRYHGSPIGTIGTEGPCNCIGPQNNDPVCPCRMENVKIIDGRYIEMKDLGPVPDSETRTDWDHWPKYSW